ncbi:MAG TPA: 3-oxoacyl-[acyl-carrier-protein] reductase [Candidatus Hypogeohydataceae bacterium YC41]
MSLKGKVAIVTGGTRGIGRAIVQELAKNGVDVAFNFLKNLEKAKEVENELNNLGVKALPVQCNVADFNQSKEMATTALKHFGKIDILVNNAGITRDNLMMRMSEQEWKEVIDTNLNGAFNITRAVVFPMMKQKSGSIINITSVSGIIGMMGQANYAASKAGLIGFTKSLAKELARFNISVNAVAPGFIDTEMTQMLDKKYIEEALKLIPMGRIGKPEEIGKAVIFLVSDASSYITGQVLSVDGGLAM